MAPARDRLAEVEQPVLQHLPTDRDRLAVEHGEDRVPQHPGPVLLQDHHLAGRAMQCPPPLDTALQGPLAPVPPLARNGPLQLQEQRLGFQLRSFFEHRHQHPRPDLGEWIGAGAPVATPLLLPLRLQLAPIDPLGAAHRDPHRMSRHLLAQPSGPYGLSLLLDPQRQRNEHRGAPSLDRTPCCRVLGPAYGVAKTRLSIRRRTGQRHPRHLLVKQSPAIIGIDFSSEGRIECFNRELN
jgi:hypothetical protein